MIPITLTVGCTGYQAGYERVGVEGESMVVPDVAAALEILHEQPPPGDVVLVKASRAVGVEPVAAGLLANRAPGPTNGAAEGIR
jgi:UDP-N-acetylmuramyl pentapeptide synthase